MKITLTDTKRKVLVQSLQAVMWSALPDGHPERNAAEALMNELAPPRQNRVTKERDSEAASTIQALIDIDACSICGKEYATCSCDRNPTNTEAPQMTTKTVNLYEFDELTDAAKEKARDWWRECEAQDFGAHGDLHEGAETAAKIFGIEFTRHDVPLMGGGKRSEPNIWWQLHVQGSGASYEAEYSYAKDCVKNIRAEFPKDQTLHRIAAELVEFQKAYSYRATAKITTDSREVHQYAMSLEAFNDQGEQLGDDAANPLLETMRTFAGWIYEGLQEDYTSRMTDENVDDSIRGNNYTFTANGKRED